MFWVAQGKTNPEIATILGLSPLTVRTHLEHIYQKLGVETRLAATVRAQETLGLRREYAPEPVVHKGARVHDTARRKTVGLVHPPGV